MKCNNMSYERSCLLPIRSVWHVIIISHKAQQIIFWLSSTTFWRRCGGGQIFFPIKVEATWNYRDKDASKFTVLNQLKNILKDQNFQRKKYFSGILKIRWGILLYSICFVLFCFVFKNNGRVVEDNQTTVLNCFVFCLFVCLFVFLPKRSESTNVLPLQLFGL